MMGDISENQVISHKRERCQKYSMEFKKATIKYAQESSIHSAAKKLKADRKRVCQWVQKEEKVTSIKEKRFRLNGGGRKLKDVELDEEVLSWKNNNMFKAKSIYDEKSGDNEELKARFVASNG